MKTIVIYDQVDANIKFAILEGDYRHLNRVYINQWTGYIVDKAERKKSDDLQHELNSLFYDKDTGKDIQTLTEVFPIKEVIDGAVVIVAGFLP